MHFVHYEIVKIKVDELALYETIERAISNRLDEDGVILGFDDE